MCGICGIIALSDKRCDTSSIKKMTDAMQHRGPNSEGHFADTHALLGHRRLSIIDLSPSAGQPMFDETKRYSIVYNGEIYNFKAIKQKLAHYPFKTSGDSEVVLAAYIEYGEKCVDFFDGMFAFAVWDAEKKKLFAARDRFGKKPFYYLQNDSHFVFASEIRSIWASGLGRKKMNKEGIIDFLSYQTVHAPQTIDAEIRMLPSGHFLTIENAHITIQSYWSLSNFTQNPFPVLSYSEHLKNIEKLLYKAVEKRLISDVPFGAFLSGGIDSSVVTGIMSKVSAQKVRTFSVSFAEEEFSEARYAKQISKLFGTEHTEIKLNPSYFLDLLPDALKTMDHPTGDGVNTYVVSKVTKEKGITMALSGLGGDELFAGYDIFKRALTLKKYAFLARLPKSLRRSMARSFQWIKPGIAAQKIRVLAELDNFDFSEFYPLNRQLFNKNEISQLVREKINSENSNKKILSQYPIDELNVLTAVSIAEMSTYMQNVLLRDTDQMSMAVSLEVRVPFLDTELAEYVFAISDKMKYPVSPKKLLTDAIGFLPDSVVNRPKMGFTFPWNSWLRNELSGFINTQFSAAADNAFFNSDATLNLLKKFNAGDKNVNWARIWNIAVLQNYLTEHSLEL